MPCVFFSRPDRGTAVRHRQYTGFWDEELLHDELTSECCYCRLVMCSVVNFSFKAQQQCRLTNFTKNHGGLFTWRVTRR